MAETTQPVPVPAEQPAAAPAAPLAEAPVPAAETPVEGEPSAAPTAEKYVLDSDLLRHQLQQFFMGCPIRELQYVNQLLPLIKQDYQLTVDEVNALSSFLSQKPFQVAQPLVQLLQQHLKKVE